MHGHGLSMPAGSENWRADMAAWGRDFRGLLARQWSQEEAHTMFERIEAFSALAELIADRDVADATAELEVYLCAFVDSDLRPDAAQRARFERLVGELDAHLQNTGGTPVETAPPAGGKRRIAPAQRVLPAHAGRRGRGAGRRAARTRHRRAQARQRERRDRRDGARTAGRRAARRRPSARRAEA